MADSVIRTEALTKYYGEVLGVENLLLEVQEGEILGFLGPNGAGKTTTLRLLMGLLRPTSGTARVFGMNCWTESVPIKEKVGYLPGEISLYPRLTGEHLVRFVAGFDGRGEEEAKQLASRLELDLSRKTGDASRGMKQKLALVLALMKQPPLLMMDEPTSGLDPLTQRILYEILNEYRERGTTILFSSHNLPEVERISDRVGIIREGHLAATEKIEDLRSKRLRHVEIIFTGELPDGLDTLPGLAEVDISGKRVRLKLRGDINPLLRKITGYDVTDMSITHASLEDVFLEFYGRGKQEQL